MFSKCILPCLAFFVSGSEPGFELIEDHNEAIVGILLWGPAGEVRSVLSSVEVQQNLEQIRVAQLRDHQPTGDEIRALTALRCLEWLSVGEDVRPLVLDKDAMSGVATHVNMTSLELYSASPTLSLESLRPLRKLEDLVIRTPVLERQSIVFLGELPNLTLLDVAVTGIIEDIAWIDSLEKLQTLRIKSAGLVGDYEQVIGNLPGLRTLEIRGFAVASERLLVLGNSLGPALESLELEIREPHALMTLPDFPKLQHLELIVPEGSPIDSSFLGKMPELETLIIRGCDKNVASFHGAVSTHPGIRRVILGSRNKNSVWLDVIKDRRRN